LRRHVTPSKRWRGDGDPCERKHWSLHHMTSRLPTLG
jgi:hypothetical protein